MMAVEWLLPTLTSVMRLLVISLLFIGNWCAVFMVIAYPKNKRDFRRTLSLTILCVNLVYLMMVWIPFTLTSVRHDLVGASEADQTVPEAITSDMAEEFVVEYIDLRSGNYISEKEWLPSQADKVAKNLHFMDIRNSLDVTRNSSEEQTAQVADNDLDFFLAWNSFIQDMQTSACIYTLTLTAVVGILISRKEVVCPCERLGVSLCGLVLVLGPLLLTLGLRYYTSTSLHHAHHTTELSHAGYSSYTLICDVHVTQEYVVVMLIECGAVVILAAGLVLAGLRMTAAPGKGRSRLYEEDKSCHHNRVSSIEECAVDGMLLLGCCWAWAKPIMILTMFCIYGPHWSSGVSWLSNMVASIPMVFLPLAVFMSRPTRTTSCCFPSWTNPSPRCTCNEEEQCQTKQPTKPSEDKVAKGSNTNTIMVQNLSHLLKPDDTDTRHNRISPGVDMNDKNYVQENLKFYLGTDILKSTKSSGPENDEKCIILKNEWLDPGTEVDNDESKA